MTGHLREQILIRNKERDLKDMSADRIQRTIDEFNQFTKGGGRMKQSARKGRFMEGKSTGWTSINDAVTRVMLQESKDFNESKPTPVVLKAGTVQVVDVNQKGKPITRRGRRVMETRRYTRVHSGKHYRYRWKLKSWKYVE